MKYIPLKAYDGGITTKAILTTVLNQNPRGMMLDEIRRRCKLMDLVEEATTHIVVKDDEFTFLSDTIKSFPFSIAAKNLLLCLDDILSADEPPAIIMREKEKKNGKGKHEESAQA